MDNRAEIKKILRDFESGDLTQQEAEDQILDLSVSDAKGRVKGFAKLVKKMRDLQSLYFKKRDRDVLIKSKEAEAVVDKQCENILRDKP